EQLGRREGVTLFMVLLAAFQIVLGRSAGQNDVVVGIPIANREFLELEGLIGFFVNTLLLRTRWNSQSSLREILANVRETTLNAHAHQDLPFDRLVDELPRPPKGDRNPLLRVMLIFQNTASVKIDLPALSLSPGAINRVTPLRTEIDLYLSRTANGLSGRFVYDAMLYDRNTIASLVTSFASLLVDISRNPDLCIAHLADPPGVELSPLAAVSRNSNGTPLSFHQERIWFVDKFETGVIYPASPTYHNIPIMLRFNGAVDSHLLEQSLNALIARHDVLRTRVIETDRGPRQVTRPYGIISIQRENITKTWDEGSEPEWMA